MLFMIEADSPVDHSFAFSKLGMMSYAEAIRIAAKINVKLIQLGSPTRFYVTPVLDV